MTKKEIFDKILGVAAEVCDVSSGSIINGCKEEDAVMARSIVVFWCYAAGFSTTDIAKQANVKNVTQVNNIKAKVEEYWVNKYIYHMVVSEVGKKLAGYADSIGEYFDYKKPLFHMSKITDKY